MSEEHPAAPAVIEVAAVPVSVPQPLEQGPASGTDAAASPVETPVVEALAVEAPAEPAATEAKPHTDEPGVLTVDAEAKPDEKPKDGEEGGEKTELPEEPIKYELKLPDGIEFQPEALERFTGLAKELNIPPEKAQELADMHIAAMQAYDAQALQAQHDVFAGTRQAWRTEIMGDPDLGGSGFKTNQAAAIRMLQLFTPPDKRTALDTMLRVTGAADHPEFFRLMVNIARKFDEPAPAPAPQKPAPNSQGRPPGASGSRIGYAYPRGGRRGDG